ncbi:MAG: hypothetical protein AAF503_14625 [Pseudomonadota bacterium]
MAPITAMSFDSEEFGASTLAPVPMAESFFNSVSGVARVINPATGEVLYGPFDVTGSHRVLSFTSPIEFEDQMEREANTEITKAFLQDLRRDIAGQP